jgi:hypothetical protein
VTAGEEAREMGTPEEKTQFIDPAIWNLHKQVGSEYPWQHETRPNSAKSGQNSAKFGQNRTKSGQIRPKSASTLGDIVIYLKSVKPCFSRGFLGIDNL